MEMQTLKSLLDTQRFLDVLKKRTEAGDEAAVQVTEQIKHMRVYTRGSQCHKWACNTLGERIEKYFETHKESADTYLLPEEQPVAI